jgi:hypothetical protein
MTVEWLQNLGIVFNPHMLFAFSLFPEAVTNGHFFPGALCFLACLAASCWWWTAGRSSSHLEVPRADDTSSNPTAKNFVLLIL